MNSQGLDAQIVVARGDRFQLDVSLVIKPGKTVALLGPNGAGKSTAVSALAGLLPIEGGHISLSGIPLDDPQSGVFVAPEARNVGVVFQDYLLFPHLTLVENIAFGLRSRRVDKKIAVARAGEWIERMGLTGLGLKRPGDLSGGQAQRVALARALANDPALLLLDEPLSALDVTTRVQLRRTLAEHLDRFDGPRLLITHDPTEAFLLADEIHVIEQGSITQVGSPDDIRLRPRTQYVADLAGANLISGMAHDGIVDSGHHLIHIADHKVAGEVLATIRPSAISVHTREPDGSPRNAWRTRIELIEHLGERTRLRTGLPLPLTVEITSDATRALGLSEGLDVWISIKATEITVERDSSYVI